MPKITLEEFFDRSTTKVIECFSREQSDAVRQAFHAMGKKWHSGDSFIKLDYWTDGDTYIYYSNSCCKGKSTPDLGWIVYSFDDIVELCSESTSEPEPEPDPHQLRVLLRSDYRWHDASWEGNTSRLSIGRNRISPTDIISVENDPRTKYVQCTRCNSIIKNTKKAIEKHAQLAQSSESCLTCEYLRFSGETKLKESLIRNDDGTYTRTEKTVCSLICGNSYSNPLIESEKARGVCMYRYCGTNTVASIDDFFIKYPGAFDDMATVDALDMSKWQIDYKDTDGSVDLKWRGRYNLRVHTTSLGIIDRFISNYRNNNYKLVYSKKYDKIFVLSWGEYSEITPANSSFSTQYYNELMKIMRNIYKGEN